jgi:hypothetical protein
MPDHETAPPSPCEKKQKKAIQSHRRRHSDFRERTAAVITSSSLFIRCGSAGVLEVLALLLFYIGKLLSLPSLAFFEPYEGHIRHSVWNQSAVAGPVHPKSISRAVHKTNQLPPGKTGRINQNGDRR